MQFAPSDQKRDNRSLRSRRSRPFLPIPKVQGQPVILENLSFKGEKGETGRAGERERMYGPRDWGHRKDGQDLGDTWGQSWDSE